MTIRSVIYTPLGLTSGVLALIQVSSTSRYMCSLPTCQMSIIINQPDQYMVCRFQTSSSVSTQFVSQSVNGLVWPEPLIGLGQHRIRRAGITYYDKSCVQMQDGSSVYALTHRNVKPNAYVHILLPTHRNALRLGISVTTRYSGAISIELLEYR